MGKFIDKFLDSIRLGDEEDDYLMDEEEDYDDVPVRKSKLRRNKDEDLYDMDEPAPAPKPKSSRPAKVVPLRSNGRNFEVCSIKPATFEDAREICDTLLAGRAVILNLEGIHMDVAQRIIDFASGACYAMNGNLQKVSNYIFVVTPETVELSGDFQDMLSDGAASAADLSSFKFRPNL